MPDATPAEGESLARLSHLEPLLAGRRTLVVCAPGEARASQAWLAARGHAGATAVADEAGAGGPFDRILVQSRDGSPPPAERLARLRSMLAPGGLLAVAVGPEASGVETTLREAFPVVEAATLLPVSGFAVVPAAAAGEMTWDGSRLAGDRPSSLLFLCGEAPSGLAGPTIVAQDAPASPAPGIAEAAEAQVAGARAEELAAEVLALTWAADDLRRALAAAVAERDALRARAGREPGPADVAGLPDLLDP